MLRLRLRWGDKEIAASLSIGVAALTPLMADAAVALGAADIRIRSR